MKPNAQINPEALKELQTKQGKQEEKLTSLQTIFYVVGIVVVIAVISLIIQFLINSAVSFQKLDEQISAQNAKIDTLIQIDTQILLNIKEK